MSDDGPPLLRPVPQRPFSLNLTSATPPEDEDASEHGQEDKRSVPQLLHADSAADGSDDASISRPGSFMNLTSSTLYGIYSPTASGRDRIFNNSEEDDTPWGTGAQTPIRRPSVDDATYELMRGRAHLQRRRSSYYRAKDTTIPHSQGHTAVSVSSLTLRAGVLFALGVGYGVLLARFQDRSQWPAATPFADKLAKTGYDWKTLAFWGIAGVVLGAAMPWSDRTWGDAIGDEEDETVDVDTDPTCAENAGRTTDGVLVMRPIGAFVGIIFAIRKLAWASTLQVSVTLALVNPLLWWLIDRSKVGFILSATVGLMGSIFLLGVTPGMMPSPPAHLVYLRGGIGGAAASFNDSVEDSTAAGATAAAVPFPLAGIASQETVEMGQPMEGAAGAAYDEF
ncbi:hypothetical protein ACO1O0_008159 [Amphichorda felina]